MPFTSATITHGFTNADGTPSSGTITFQLTKRMSQPGQSIMPGEIATSLSSTGGLSQSLTSTVDTGTLPQDAETADALVDVASRGAFFAKAQGGDRVATAVDSAGIADDFEPTGPGRVESETTAIEELLDSVPAG